MKTAWFFLMCSLSIQPVFGSHYPVTLGDTCVIIELEKRGPGKAFVHLHQDEVTALKAAQMVIHSQGGTLLTLIHTGKRNIVFHLNQQRYEFDPNRIFTDAGIQKTLRQFGPYSIAAHHTVKRLAEAIKQRLPKGKIIAVHNNRSYSLKDYLPGHLLASDARALYYSDKHHYRNFYLTTQKTDYLRLKRLKFNGILQAKNATDDGSLSIYLAHRAYINVEAGYDQLSAQIKMLRYA